MKTIILILTLFPGMGLGFDKLLALRHKEKLHYAMIRWWDRLDETAIPDYPRLLSTWLLSRVQRILKLDLRRTLIAYLLICFAFLSGASLLNWITPEPADPAFVSIPLPRQPPLPQPQNWFESVKLPHVLLILAVLPFDFVTLAATIASLRLLTLGGPGRNMTVLVVNLFATSALAVGCFAAVMFANNMTVNYNMIGVQYERELLKRGEIAVFNYQSARLTNYTGGMQLSTNAIVTYYHVEDSFVDDLKQAPAALAALLLRRPIVLWKSHLSVAIVDGKERAQWTRSESAHIGPALLLFTGTVFYPAVAVIGALIFMLLGKLVLMIFRGVLMYFFDLATEKNPKEFIPGTLIGISLGLLVTLVQGLWKLLLVFGK